jgi:hypothetical protein
VKFEADPYFIAPHLEDWEWLQVLEDLEDLDFGPDTMQFNMKMRPHLEREKKMLLLNHLLCIN